MILNLVIFISVARIIGADMDGCEPGTPCPKAGYEKCCAGEYLNGIGICQDNGVWEWHPCSPDQKCVETISAGTAACL